MLAPQVQIRGRAEFDGEFSVAGEAVLFNCSEYHLVLRRAMITPMAPMAMPMTSARMM
jgi:hypothetical protein